MDWFERLTGFRETSWAETRSKLNVEHGRLTSLVNGKSYGIGTLELASLRELRERLSAGEGPHGELQVDIVVGNARTLHHDREHRGALFQVASQFNLLEMPNQHVTPEAGVTSYEGDHTQGPACAIAAGAATIYRNYFAPCGNGFGQTAKRQIDALADLGRELSAATRMPVTQLWSMRNGYAMCTDGGLAAIEKYLAGLDEGARDALRGALRVGLHRDVEVTDAPGDARPVVSQAFCSALPVGYADPSRHWAPFATLVLEAAYEATLWEGVLNARRGASNVVLLTFIGGGVFRNDVAWIDAAMRRALTLARGYDLRVKLVCYGKKSREAIALARDFGNAGGAA